MRGQSEIVFRVQDIGYFLRGILHTCGGERATQNWIE
jgi:hypothetical protein